MKGFSLTLLGATCLMFMFPASKGQDELTRDLSVDYPREMEANYPHDMDANQFPRDMDAHRPRDMDVRQFGGILFGVRDEGNAVNAGVHEQGSIDLTPQKA